MSGTQDHVEIDSENVLTPRSLQKLCYVSQQFASTSAMMHLCAVIKESYKTSSISVSAPHGSLISSAASILSLLNASQHCVSSLNKMGISFRPFQSQDNNASLQMLGGHSDCINSLVFSDDSEFLASASCDRTVKLWIAESGKLLHTLEGHQNCVSSVTFLPDSKTLVSASCDKTIKIWSIKTGECLRTLTDHHDCVTSVMFLPDTNQLVSTSCDNTVGIWNMKSWDFCKSRRATKTATAPWRTHLAQDMGRQCLVR